jgi:hypothetical protein
METIELMKQRDDVLNLGASVSRSTIAVIDIVTQRGGFKGEELGSIAQLRAQAAALVEMHDAAQQAAADQMSVEETADAE